MTNTHGEHAPSPFLRGDAPVWYYVALMLGLATIGAAHFVAGPAVAGWILIGCVVATFMAAHKVFPLAAAGTLTVFGLFLGLTNVHAWEHEIEGNLKVLLLVACMVPAIHFFKELLELGFITLLLKVSGKLGLSLAFFAFGAVTSAFFDALTVAALALASIGVIVSNYLSKRHAIWMAGANNSWREDEVRTMLSQFLDFLTQLLMHLLVGTMTGGLSTLIGEPQNLGVGEMMGWSFSDYFFKMLHISGPINLAGVITVVLLEATPIGRYFFYGTKLPGDVREYLQEYATEQGASRSSEDRYRLTVQAVCGLALIVALGLQAASIGLLGLITMIVVSQGTGRIAENRYVPAYHAAMPFFALLLVFFGAVSIIHEQHLFDGLMRWIAGLPQQTQLLAMYLETGAVSSISDNVFVAVAHASNVVKLQSEGVVTAEQADKLAIAIIAGTNIVSIATPNGQAAFLLAICSDTAKALRLSYFKMLWMAFPYTVILGAVGALTVSNP